MEKREKIIRELEVVKRRLARLDHFAEEAETIEDAIVLLKEQQETIWALEIDLDDTLDVMCEYAEELKAQGPRVMTLEEVKSAWRNRNIAFLVEYNDGGNPVWMLYYGYLSTLEEIVLMDEIAHLRHFGVDGYNVDWRCWTSRPTDAQREAVKWDDRLDKR